LSLQHQPLLLLALLAPAPPELLLLVAILSQFDRHDVTAAKRSLGDALDRRRALPRIIPCAARSPGLPWPSGSGIAKSRS
jgi:hypothetical protein